jgi:release factor glutamine methyltransferase
VTDAAEPVATGSGGPTRRTTVGAAIVDATKSLTGSGSASARLDAEVLLGHVLGVDRASLAAYPEAPLGDGHAATYRMLVERRATGEPVAYIRGLKEFHGVALHVDPRVLIPRPETETLVDLSLQRITTALTSGRRDARSAPFLVWDVGTGSGAIAIAIASALRRRRYGDVVRFHLSDVSGDALAVAVENAVSHGVADLMDFGLGDLAAAEAGPDRPADLLVANLPYVPAAMVPALPVAASFEPVLALDGGDDGLTVIRRLLPALPDALAPGGVALLEIGSDQDDAITIAATELLPGWTCSIAPDLSGAARVAVLEAPDA